MHSHSKKVAYVALVVGMFTIASFTNNNQHIPLLEAINKNMVEIEATSNGKYSGYSVTFDLINISGKKLNVIIPAGTKYIPEDPGEQTLIQLEDQFYALRSQEKISGKSAAFCTEAGDRCPSENTSMKIAMNNNPKFGKLINYMKGKNINKGTYQDAVWAISDNHSVANIVAEDPTSNAFRKYIAGLTGQKDTWFTSPQSVQVDQYGNINRETLKIAGKLSFECPAGTVVHQDIYKGNGEPFFVSDKTMTARYGKISYEFRLSVLGWEKGDYYIKIHDGTNELAKYDFKV